MTTRSIIIIIVVVIADKLSTRDNSSWATFSTVYILEL